MIPREYNMEGKVAIVTGGGRGIGKAIALVLAEAGVDVVVAARTVEQIEGTAKEIRGLGQRALAVPTDVTRAAQVENMVKKAISEFGKIDILVNDAGASYAKQLIPLPGVKLPGWEEVGDLNTPMSEEEWHLTMNTNLTSVFLCTRAVGPHMIKQRKGKVINLSSVNADMGLPYQISCNTSKAGVSMFTRCLALEWAPFNINVNAIGPGDFPTPLTTKIHNDPQLREQMLRCIHLGRTGNVRDLGLLALYLASDASNYMTGQTIFLDGGELALSPC